MTRYPMTCVLFCTFHTQECMGHLCKKCTGCVAPSRFLSSESIEPARSDARINCTDPKLDFAFGSDMQVVFASFHNQLSREFNELTDSLEGSLVGNELLLEIKDKFASWGVKARANDMSVTN